MSRRLSTQLVTLAFALIAWTQECLSDDRKRHHVAAEWCVLKNVNIGETWREVSCLPFAFINLPRFHSNGRQQLSEFVVPVAFLVSECEEQEVHCASTSSNKSVVFSVSRAVYPRRQLPQLQL